MLPRRYAIFALMITALASAVLYRVLTGFRPTMLTGFILFGLAFFIFESTATRLSGGDLFSNDEATAIAAILMLSPSEAAIAVLAGTLVGRLVRWSDERHPVLSLVEVSRRFLVVYGFSLLAHGSLSLDRLARWPFLLFALALGLLFVIVDHGSYALEYSLRKGLPFFGTVTSLTRLIGGLVLGQISLGIAIAVLYPSMGYGGLLLLLGLLLVLRQSFTLLLRIRWAYRDTIAALARATELQGANERGHAERVALVAVAIAREMGYRGRRLEEMNYAALLHDIGKIGLEVGGEPDTDHAKRGAEVIGKIPFLRSVESVVRMHHDPPAVLVTSPSSPHRLGAAIIQIADAVDAHVSRGLSQQEVILLLEREVLQEFGPALSRATLRALRRRDIGCKLFDARIISVQPATT